MQIFSRLDLKKTFNVVFLRQPRVATHANTYRSYE